MQSLQHNNSKNFLRPIKRKRHAEDQYIGIFDTGSTIVLGVVDSKDDEDDGDGDDNDEQDGGRDEIIVPRATKRENKQNTQ
jgi:hypothetical protein